MFGLNVMARGSSCLFLLFPPGSGRTTIIVSYCYGQSKRNRWAKASDSDSSGVGYLTVLIKPTQSEQWRRRRREKKKKKKQGKKQVHRRERDEGILYLDALCKMTKVIGDGIVCVCVGGGGGG